MIQSKIYTFDLTAGASKELLVAGDFFLILSSTGAVKVNATFGELDNLTTGNGLEKTHFERLLFTDRSGASNTVRVFIGDENFITGITGAMAVTSNKVPQSGAFVNVNATVTNASAQLLAANAARQYMLVQNKDAAGSIYLNFSAAATVANGVLIGPGGVYELTGIASTKAINAIGSIASNANIVTVEG